MSIPIQPGNVLPLAVYWADVARTDLVVRAQVYARESGAVLFADVPLTYMPGSNAIYRNTSNLMPDEDIVDVRYDVFDSDGTTLLGSGEEVFVSDTDGGGGGGTVQPLPLFGTVKSLSSIKGIVTCEG